MMKFIKSLLAAPTVAIGIIMVLLTGVHAQTTVAEWQAKAVQEYPELATPNSKMNSKFRERVTELKRTNPAYFNDPKWPYTLAKSLDPKAQIIPGLDVESLPSTAKPRIGIPMATQKKMPIYTGQLLSAGVDSLKDQQVCVEGTVKSQYIPPMSDGKTFYVLLEPNIVCQFGTDDFTHGSYYYVMKFGGGGNDEIDVKVQENQAMLYKTSSHYSKGRQIKQTKPIRPILAPNEKVLILGTVVGLGNVGAGPKGIILRNCIATPEISTN